MEKNTIHRNNVRIIGSGTTPLLFVNGYGCDQNIWRFVTPAFTDDYKVILFDHVGSGRSDLSAYDFEKYNSLESYADDILELCQELKLSNTIIVGHSVGSMISLLAAKKQPQLFSKVVLVTPSPYYINENGYQGGFSKEDINELIENVESNYLGWASAITPVIMGNPDRPELTEELTHSFCRNDPKIAQHFARVTFSSDNRQDLPDLKNETLIIQVTDDIIAPMSVGKYLYKKIPNSRLAIIEGNGHCPHLSHSDETIDAIKAFLS